MDRYPAFVEHDKETDLYGVVFPDLTGIVAIGESFDEALMNAEAALRDCIEVMDERGWSYAEPSKAHGVGVPAGNVLVSIPLIRPSAETVRANL